METVSIKNVKDVFMGNLGTVSKNQNTSEGESFAKVFDQTQSTREENSPEQEVKASDSKKADNVKDYEKLSSSSKTDKLKEKMEQLEKIAEEERLQQAAEEAGSVMVEKVAETLHVTVEEVETVMEALGLNSLDLLNCENLTRIVLAFHPEMDALSLMTEEHLFTDLKSLMNTANDLLAQLQKEFQMSEEEIVSYLQSMEEFTGTEISDLAEEAVYQEQSGLENDLKGEGSGEQDDNSVTLFKDNNNVHVVEDTSLESSAALKTEGADRGKDTSHGDGNGSEGRESFSQTMMRQLTEAVEKAEANQSIYSTSGEDIIHQITDYIKLHVKPQTTELELQLHPASLGNVKVQIASTEGILTATFITQNEAVKAALEAQLIQLKENFEQQGLKVESIEVNVATQGFERSLDQQANQNGQYEENNKRSGRKIRLSGIESLEDLLEEDLPEEDKVVADMMLRNGNTVDYTV